MLVFLPADDIGDASYHIPKPLSSVLYIHNSVNYHIHHVYTWTCTLYIYTLTFSTRGFPLFWQYSRIRSNALCAYTTVSRNVTNSAIWEMGHGKRGKDGEISKARTVLQQRNVMLILQPRLLTLIHINLGGMPDKSYAFSLLRSMIMLMVRSLKKDYWLVCSARNFPCTCTVYTCNRNCLPWQQQPARNTCLCVWQSSPWPSHTRRDSATLCHRSTTGWLEQSPRQTK